MYCKLRLAPNHALHDTSILLLQEQLLLEPMFEVPGSNVKSVHIEEDTVLGKHAPRYEYHEEGDARDDGEEGEGEEDSNEIGSQEREGATTRSVEVAAVEQSTAKV